MEPLATHFVIAHKKLSLYRFSLPLKKTLHLKGHCLQSRQGLWLIEHRDNATDLIGEICPLPGFSKETLAQCEQQVLQLLQSITADNCDGILLSTLLPSVSFALQCLAQHIPWEQRPEKSNLLLRVPLLQGDKEEIVTRYQQLYQPNLVKLKVARDSVEKDLERLQCLIKINPNIRFRLDANQQWSASQYHDFLTGICHSHIDYIEEATASMNDNLAISTLFKVPVALDESLLSMVELPQRNCIKTLVIKPTLIGYHDRLDALLRHAQQQQLNISVSASFESPLALQQLHYLAVKWQQQTNLTINLGLDTLHVFTPNIVNKVYQVDADVAELLSEATCLWHN